MDMPAPVGFNASKFTSCMIQSKIGEACLDCWANYLKLTIEQGFCYDICNTRANHGAGSCHSKCIGCADLAPGARQQFKKCTGFVDPEQTFCGTPPKAPSFVDTES